MAGDFVPATLINDLSSFAGLIQKSFVEGSIGRDPA